jgi:hypothetical protein
MKASEAIAHLQALEGDQDLAITWWTREEVIDFAYDFYDEMLDISEHEWVTALNELPDNIGIINEQMWEQITDTIKTNKGEKQ